MANFCAIVGCSNRADRDKTKSFYRLPSIISHQGEKTYELSKERRAVWLARIKREDLQPENYPYTRVCSDHFVCGKPAPLYDKQNQDWDPSQHLGYQRLDQGNNGGERASRALIRASRKRTRDELEGESVAETGDEPEPQCSKSRDVAVQTSISGGIFDAADHITMEVHELKTNVSQLKTQVKLLQSELSKCQWSEDT